MTPETQVHIAEIDFPELYAPVFGSLAASTEFFETIQSLPDSKKDAKVVLHQAGRMVWLADMIDEVARGRPAFQVLFYLVAAELVAKIAVGFEGEGQSRSHVQKFFTEICSSESKQRLSWAFRHAGGAYLSLAATVDLLYKVRCDVVHRGQYYTFSLQRSESSIPMLSSVGEHSPISEISLPDLRQIVLEGAVLAAKLIAEIGT
jgi:hypothetical protein